ncbi:hypothetical protein [Streptomyces sp. SA15]|uniref:hypothetical protein n=1 Tax=Streptomyces sp. SA15 TaxID=934019 RepID=UPI0015C90E19|nr:hypothetical protein [Streptomyces sp. SA15]
MPRRSRACIFSAALQEIVKAVADAAELWRELLRHRTDDRCYAEFFVDKHLGCDDHRPRHRL